MKKCICSNNLTLLEHMQNELKSFSKLVDTKAKKKAFEVLHSAGLIIKNGIHKKLVKETYLMGAN